MSDRIDHPLAIAVLDAAESVHRATPTIDAAPMDPAARQTYARVTSDRHAAVKAWAAAGYPRTVPPSLAGRMDEARALMQPLDVGIREQVDHNEPGKPWVAHEPYTTADCTGSRRVAYGATEAEARALGEANRRMWPVPLDVPQWAALGLDLALRAGVAGGGT